MSCQYLENLIEIQRLKHIISPYKDNHIFKKGEKTVLRK